jgi:hypothetical protein
MQILDHLPGFEFHTKMGKFFFNMKRSINNYRLNINKLQGGKLDHL